MELIECATAIRHMELALRHPRWWTAAILGGRKALLQRIVIDSINQVRSVSKPNSLEELVSRNPVSDLGKMGATQEYLYFLVRYSMPEIAVETGVYRGISTAFLLAGMEDNRIGRLFSIDLPSASYRVHGTPSTDASPLRTHEETGFAVPYDIRKRWTLRLGDTRKELPVLLSELGNIDLFYHDSEHTSECMEFEYGQAAAHLRRRGFLTSDDVNWNDAFRRFTNSSRFSWKTVVRGRLGMARIGDLP